MERKSGSCSYMFDPEEQAFPRESLEKTPCNREVWQDEDRCILHADVESKPESEIEDALNDGHEIRGSDFTGIALNDEITFADKDLTLCDFSGSTIRNVNFRNAFMEDAIFTEAELTDLRMENAFLDTASFAVATIRNVSFTSSSLRDANFSDASISECTFDGCRLHGSIFASASLSNADFSRAGKLEHAVFDEAYLLNADLSGRDLSGATFSNADLHLSNLSAAVLPGADMSGANLSWADLSGAALNGADCSQADLSKADLTDASFSDAYLRDVRITESTEFGERCVFEKIADYEAETRTYTTVAEHRSANGWQSYDPSDPDIRRPFKRFFGRSGERFAHLDNAILMYRAIQRLLRENDLPDQILHYKIREKHARRKRAVANREHWKWFKLAVSRWTSLYGESPTNVIAVSLSVVFVSAVLYPIWGIRNPEGGILAYPVPLSELPVVLGKSVYFSTATFTTLGYGDVQPVGWSQMLSSIESFSGALFMALLVFVLGRRATW